MIIAISRWLPFVVWRISAGPVPDPVRFAELYPRQSCFCRTHSLYFRCPRDLYRGFAIAVALLVC